MLDQKSSWANEDGIEAAFLAKKIGRKMKSNTKSLNAEDNGHDLHDFRDVSDLLMVMAVSATGGAHKRGGHNKNIMAVWSRWNEDLACSSFS